MTEEIIRKYYCDFCTKEIDQESGIQIYARDDRIIVKQIETTAGGRDVVIRLDDSEYCSVYHLAAHIEQLLDVAREYPVSGFEYEVGKTIKISEMMAHVGDIITKCGDLDIENASIKFTAKSLAKLLEAGM